MGLATTMTLNSATATFSSHIPSEEAETTLATKVKEPQPKQQVSEVSSEKHYDLEKVNSQGEETSPQIETQTLSTDIDVDGFSFNETTQTITSYLYGGGDVEVDVVIPATIRGMTVLAIGDKAFEGRHLTSITFEEGSQIQSIGEMAFANNLEVTTSITLPETVTSIGANAFQNTKAEVIYIPGATRAELGLSDSNGAGLGVCEERYTSFSTSSSGTLSTSSIYTTLGVETALVFSDCTYDQEQALLILGDGTLKGFYPEHSTFGGSTEVVLPDGVTTIGSYAFAAESSEYTIKFPSTLESINEYAFVKTGLESLDFSGTSLKTLGKHSFAYSSLREVNIEGTQIESIGTYCFDYCYSLESFDMGECVTLLEIPNYCFRYCTALETIVLPPNLEVVGNYAFNRASALTSIYTDEIPLSRNLKTIGTYGFSGTPLLTVPLYLYSIESIDDYAFGYYSSTASSCQYSGFTEIHFLSNTLTSFPYLRMATNLTEVTLCDSITSLPSSGFNGLTNLSSLNWLDEEGVLHEQANKIPTKVKSIPTYMFYGCTWLDSIDVSNATTIGQYAFYGCTGLISVDLKNVATFSGSYTFYGCNNLETLLAPNLVTISSSNSFGNCYALKTITVDSLQTAKGSEFLRCYALEEIELPSLTEIPSTMFSSCTSLKSVSAPVATTVSTSAFLSCVALEEVNLDNVETIGNTAFSGCSSSALNLTLPSSITSIGTNAFLNITASAITIDRYIDEVSGAPWGSDSTVTWILYLGTTKATNPLDGTEYLISIDEEAKTCSILNYRASTTDLVIPETLEAIDGVT